MWLFNFMNPALSFWETLNKCLDYFETPWFLEDHDIVKMKIMEISWNSDAKIAILETLKKDWYKINNDANSLSVFIMESYFFYLNSIGKWDRSIYKIENVDFPIIQWIIKSWQ